MSDFLDRYVRTAGSPSLTAIRASLWNATADQPDAAAVIRQQYESLNSSWKALSREGFSRVYVMKSPEEVAAARVVID